MEKMRAFYRNDILRSPSSVVLTRIESVEDEYGNVKDGEPTALPSQKVRIEYLRPDFDAVDTSGGTIFKNHVRMIALHNADVKIADTFPFGGSTYSVKSIISDNGAGLVIFADAFVEV